MTDVLERLERVERLLGIATAGRLATDGIRPATPVAAPAPAGQEAGGRPTEQERPPERAPRVSLGDWVRSKRERPDEIVVGVVVSTNASGLASNSHAFGRSEVPFDLKYTAGLFQALANETRLAMLRELFGGTRTRAELMEALGLDRGQLYHHLRDLFVHGLVVQPVRGSYKITGRGTCIFLAAGTAAELGGREGPSIPFDPNEDDETSGKTAAA